MIINSLTLIFGFVWEWFLFPFDFADIAKSSVALVVIAHVTTTRYNVYTRLYIDEV